MPPQVPKLDASTEDRLKQALGDVSRLVDGGLTPNAAIVKIASERQIQPGHIQLMVQAYNTGRTQYQLHSSDDPLQKAASFPIANTDAILNELFPKEIKTAAAVFESTVVSGDYNISPSLLLPAYQHVLATPVALEKAASAEKPKRAETELEHYHRIGSDYERAVKEAEDAKLSEVKLTYESASLIEKLAAYFQRPQALSFPAVRANSVRMFGKQAELLFDELAAHNPRLTKSATVYHRVDWNAEPYTLIDTVLQKAAAYAEAVAAVEQADATLKTAKQVFYDPFAARPLEAATTAGSIWDQLSSRSDPEKTAAAPGTAMSFGAGAALSSAVKGLVETLMPPKEDMIRGQLNRLQDPGHEESIRAIRTQTMLSDLMRNDPVISGYQPDQVYDAYNRISEVVPTASQSSMVTRALVRRYLEQSQNMDPFEIDQMMNVENKLRSQQGPPPGSPGKPIAIK